MEPNNTTENAHSEVTINSEPTPNSEVTAKSEPAPNSEVTINSEPTPDSEVNTNSEPTPDSEMNANSDINGDAHENPNADINLPLNHNPNDEISADSNMTINTEINTPTRENTNNEMNDEQRDTIFAEEDGDKAALAEINFDLVDAGRWLLKVIAGPNNGAEFSMHSTNSYVIGTDPSSCDIVFHDTSVSRQHARISIAADDGMSIEDLKSRNQTLVDGEAVKAKRKLMPNAVVTIGTTSFTVYDREGEMQTIISPLLPAIVKVLQKEEPPPPPKKAEPEVSEELKPIIPETPLPLLPAEKPQGGGAVQNLGAFIVLGIIAGLFGIIGLGTVALFKSEPVFLEQTSNAQEVIADALKPFPSINPYFNQATGVLQLMGHVLTQSDKTRLMYALQGLSFIKATDDSGVIIDEYVWQESNAMLSKNPNWKSITVQASTPGKFILTGYLQTRNQADELSEYIANNFIYPELLERRITVEEDVVSKVNSIMLNSGFRNVVAKMENGVITLSGGIPPEKEEQLTPILEELAKISGVRDVKNLTVKIAVDQSMINISDKYEVTGVSRKGLVYSVVINGRILTKGDELDGMQLKEIRPNAIFLEKEGVQYRIDYSR